MTCSARFMIGRNIADDEDKPEYGFCLISFDLCNANSAYCPCYKDRRLMKMFEYCPHWQKRTLWARIQRAMLMRYSKKGKQ